MPFALACALIGLVLTAAVYDFRFRRIPNWLNVSGAILGVGLNTLMFSQHGFARSCFGLLLPLAVYIPLYLLRAMGAGDAKLMAAVGSIIGPQNWLLLLLYTALCGGVIAFAVAALRGRLRRTFSNTALVVHNLLHFQSPANLHEDLNVRSSRAMRLPHAVTIAAGSLTFLSATLLFAH